MHVDFIIVGLGLAGVAFAEELRKNGKTFIVYEDNSQNSSLVAGGMYNPVVLKRFTPVWNAKEQLEIALPFYKKLEDRFDNKYQYSIEIYRIFKSIEEQNNWFTKSDNSLLEEYMIPKIIKNTNQHVKAPFDCGKLKNTGRIDVNLLANDYRENLRKSKKMREVGFKYADIIFEEESIEYQDVKSKHIVFCEGFGLKENPFFNYLPMREAKGELLTIYSPDLKVDYLIKSAVFIMPIGNDLYKVGATFNWKDKTKLPTPDGKNELESKLNSVIDCDYKIVDHVAGIRPTVLDRRPLLGIHKKHKQLAILNGLGTRGVMIAPLMAKKLFQNIEKGAQLDKEIDIARFE